MKVLQVCVGTFHHFSVARELNRSGHLYKIATGVPRFRLKAQGLPGERILSFPFVHPAYYALVRLGWSHSALGRAVHWRSLESIDRFASRHVDGRTAVFALSGCGLHAGRTAQGKGGVYICDRGSTHIHFQRRTMEEEFRRWGLTFDDMYDRGCRKELAEYEAADAVTVPSRFCRQTFVNEGVDPDKVKVIPYGVPTETFFPDGEAPTDRFRVLFVGQVCLRKGVPYLLDAFARLRHPRKELLLAGLVAPEIAPILKRFNLENVRFLGHQPREELRRLMSTSSLMVLPSIEEGLAFVQGQALACGCPLLITEATGGEELIENGVQGLIVQSRSSEALLRGLNEFAENPAMRAKMAEAALARSHTVCGWETYAQALIALIGHFSPNTPIQPIDPT